MEFLACAAFVLVAAVLAVFLKQVQPVIAFVLVAAASAVLLVKIVTAVFQPLQSFLELLLSYGVEKSAVAYLLKALGIFYLARFCQDLCLDFGQSALAVKIELAGRMAVFLLSLPLVIQVLQTALSLL